MDGFELLAYMSKNHPDKPVIVMTAYCTPEIKERVEAMGAFQLQEKPLDFQELVNNIFTQLSIVSKGYIRGITLPAFIQLVEMEKKTCTLKILSNKKTGYLCFHEGQLIDANNGILKGEKAALDIVCWDDVEIEINNICRETSRSIESSLSYILMEGFRIKDEQGRAEDNGDKALGEGLTVLARNFDAIPRGSDMPDNIGGNFNLKEEQKEAKMAGLKEILNELTKLQGVNAVCLVGRDGFLLDSVARTGIDSEMVGAIASSGFGASESMGRQLGKGEMSMSMIEFENGPVMFSPVGGDAFLVIIADKDSNLGMIRLKLKKYSPELALAVAV